MRVTDEQMIIILVDQVCKIYWNVRFPFNWKKVFFYFTLLLHIHMRAFPSLTLLKIVQACNIDW